VVWFRRSLQSGEGEAGLECLDAGKKVWGVDLPQEVFEKKAPRASSSGH
jgi:hypothetical protein